LEPTTRTDIPGTSGRRVVWQRNGDGRPRDRYWLHVLLFALTLASTVYMGGELAGRWLYYAEWGLEAFIVDGLRFGGSLLLFLTVHEFGHYFAARYHGIDTSLPYYIPLPFVGVGTLGAVIRIREPIPSLRKLFDIGAAGPLAGFVASLAILLYALFTLPPPTYMLDLPGHEALKSFIEQYGHFPAEALPGPEDGQGMTLVVGDTLLYWLLRQFFTDVPPMYEMYHYPVLFAGWLGLFFTALNLLPVGQLDGGHILYSLFGHRWHVRLARGFFVLLLISGAIGFVDAVVPEMYAYRDWLGSLSWFILAGILYFYLHRIYKGDHRLIAPSLVGIVAVVMLAQVAGETLLQFGYSGWFIWCLLIVFLIRIEHPPVLYREPLTRGRYLLGILSIVIFVLCFSFKPLYVV
jgi:membrane-associated protease RseP (regulator of RpoE activity)